MRALSRAVVDLLTLLVTDDSPGQLPPWTLARMKRETGDEVWSYRAGSTPLYLLAAWCVGIWVDQAVVGRMTLDQVICGLIWALFALSPLQMLLNARPSTRALQLAAAVVAYLCAAAYYASIYRSQEWDAPLAYYSTAYAGIVAAIAGNVMQALVRSPTPWPPTPNSRQ